MDANMWLFSGEADRQDELEAALATVHRYDSHEGSIDIEALGKELTGMTENSSVDIALSKMEDVSSPTTPNNTEGDLDVKRVKSILSKEKKRANDRMAQRKKREKERREREELLNKIANLEAELQKKDKELENAKSLLQSSLKPESLEGIKFATPLGQQSVRSAGREEYLERKQHCLDEYLHSASKLFVALSAGEQLGEFPPGFSEALAETVRILPTACFTCGQIPLEAITGRVQPTEAAGIEVVNQMHARWIPLVARLKFSESMTVSLLAARDLLLQQLDRLYKERQNIYCAMKARECHLTELVTKGSSSPDLSPLETNLQQERSLRIGFHSSFFSNVTPLQAAIVITDALPELPNVVALTHALHLMKNDPQYKAELA
eukprot:GFYU01003225.1.p1 GENE.GFYU01003225.1~~GFYU01003225.1.p1  ORF type:complete len:379 (+),score=86.40 GFYU01003225.1:225-1361(+)